MRRKLATVAALAVVMTACTAGGGEETPAPTVNPSGSNEPVTISIWGAWTGREYKDWIKIFDRFEEQYPWITVEPKGGIDDNKITAAIKAGNPPDAVLSFGVDNVGKWCDSGALQNLNPFIENADPNVGLDLAATFPASALTYTSYDGIQCSLPFMTDTYGLYYNVDLVEEAGLDPASPPRTTDELIEWAKALTVTNPDGSIGQAGFIPTNNAYCGWCYPPLVFGHAFGATWLDENGDPAFAADEDWAAMYAWQKELIDFYGYDNLQRFAAGLGDEWGAEHSFYDGKVAMLVDGEWRNAFIADGAPDLNYMTAPFPVAPDNEEMYGSGVTGGTVIGIPKGSPNPAEAWLLIRFMATDTETLLYMTNKINNVPTTNEALASPDLQVSEQFQTFLDIFNHPASAYVPTTVLGFELQDYINQFSADWQAGDAPDLEDGLQTAAERTRTALEQSEL